MNTNNRSSRPGKKQKPGSEAENRHVYGPVPSRRLGFSLGVDIIPAKTCSLDCIYCQLGPNPSKTVRRRSFIPANRILSQVKKAVDSGAKINFITFSGSGEPTLSKDIGRLIRRIKKMTDIPVAVLTNATLLTRKDVCRDLLAADLVAPSLDAARPEFFMRVNRPHDSLRLEKIIDGLVLFRKEFKGRIWLEIMLVKGMNDSVSHLKKLKEAVDRIRPDRIHLNTVVRPPAEKKARPLTRRELDRIRNHFGENCEVIADFPGERQPSPPQDLGEAVVAMAGRRPVTVEDLSVALGKHPDEVRKCLDGLIGGGKIRAERKGSTTFYLSG